MDTRSVWCGTVRRSVSESQGGVRKGVPHRRGSGRPELAETEVSGCVCGVDGVSKRPRTLVVLCVGDHEGPLTWTVHGSLWTVYDETQSCTMY